MSNMKYLCPTCINRIIFLLPNFMPHIHLQKLSTLSFFIVSIDLCLIKVTLKSETNALCLKLIKSISDIGNETNLMSETDIIYI